MGNLTITLAIGDYDRTLALRTGAVRAEVAPKSRDWGYDLGSVYIRKVHFRDAQMIRQIEENVVNRLRQVTSAIKQDGANQVGIITSTADRQASVAFAKAAAMRPQIVGSALQQIGQDREVLGAMFDILEAQKIVEGQAGQGSGFVIDGQGYIATNAHVVTNGTGSNLDGGALMLKRVYLALASLATLVLAAGANISWR